MPLTRKQFELGINSDVEAAMRRIHSYLSEHKDQAFTKEEIALALGVSFLGSAPQSGEGREKYWERVKHYRDFEVALEKLIELRVVEGAEISATTYYAAGRRPLESFLEP